MKSYSEAQVLAQLKTALIAHGSQRKAAKALGLNETVLSDVLNGRKQITERMLQVAGFERVREVAVTYRKVAK
jgi:DNA-binding transcriptional regulator YdaS (Cro superfamily)